MRRFGIPQALFMSFFSRELYRDVGRNWRGVGLLYLVCLLLLAAIPAAVKLHLGYSTWVDRDAREAVSRLPHVSITNGEVSTDFATPYYLRSGDDDVEYVLVIDLTGQYRTLQDVDARVLLTNNAISYKNRNEIRTYDLSGVQKFDIDGERVKGWLEAARSFIGPIAYVCVSFFTFVYRAVQVAIYAAIGLLFVKVKKAKLEYPAMMRLAAVAVTPVLILNEVVFALNLQIPTWSLICFAIAMGYLFFAVDANATPEIKPPLPGPAEALPPA